MSAPLIPQIPITAPFSAEQRAWLNGFFAGLFSREAAAGPGVTAPAAPQKTLTVLFASESGNGQGLAKRLVKEAKSKGFDAKAVDAAGCEASSLAGVSNLLIIASTFGDGEPPSTAVEFWNGLSATEMPALTKTRYAVLALGDSSYPKFCEFGRQLDRKLAELGGVRLLERVECDKDFDEPFATWSQSVLPMLEQEGPAPVSCPIGPTIASVPRQDMRPRGTEAWSRRNPYHAPLLKVKRLTSEKSLKDTRHVEFCLRESGLNYEPGDALGVSPRNCEELVDEVLCAAGLRGDESINNDDGSRTTLRDALASGRELRRVSRPMVEALAARAKSSTVARLVESKQNQQMQDYLAGREVVDLLHECGNPGLGAEDFVELLSPLQPRLYSISSSPRAHEGEVHLTVGVVRYETHGRHRKGVCSTFLSDRAAAGSRLPVYVHVNRAFRLPADPEKPVIMIGPGTGIAPFRAFLHDRKATGARGRNWLFFGNPNSATDLLYHDELESLKACGILSRLDLAFSRDQAEKLYVQHLMLQNAKAFYEWLEEGAHLYVCGDASRMAKDVDAALHAIVRHQSGRSEDSAMEYVAAMREQNRYQRDVY